MGFWKLLDDFWGPLEDAVDDCCEARNRRIDKEIREDIERDRLRDRLKKEKL